MSMINIYSSYSFRDKELARKLEYHLKDYLLTLRRNGMTTDWHDRYRQVAAGVEWKSEIDIHLLSADIILLLVSPDFIASDYCWGVEVKRALDRHERGEARVIPIILRPCSWGSTPLGRLQALPSDARPVTSWTNQDAAFENIALNILRIVGSRNIEPERGSNTAPDQKQVGVIIDTEKEAKYQL